MKQLFLLIFISVAVNTYAQSQLNLTQCEELFQKNNLTLLASQYNISMSEARVIQARIWDRPYFSGEVNAINPDAGKYLDAGSTGQKAFAVQQLIYLGGKKRREVELARSDLKLARLEYEQLIRTLRFELRNCFYTIYFCREKIQSIQNQLGNLDTLIASYSAQSQKGNIPLKDVVRLQSLSISLKSEMVELRNEIFDRQEEMKVLTGQLQAIVPVVDKSTVISLYLKPVLLAETDLKDKMLATNPEYKSTEAMIENNELLVHWQQSMAVPDLTFGVSYDQRGGAFHNQTNFTFGIPIPLWKQNRGTILESKARLDQSKSLKELKLLELQARLQSNIRDFEFHKQQYLQAVPAYRDFDTVYNGILLNFQKRNISLIEFTDFMESYNHSIMFMNDISRDLIMSGESLNYLTNAKLFE